MEARPAAPERRGRGDAITPLSTSHNARLIDQGATHAAGIAAVTLAAALVSWNALAAGRLAGLWLALGVLAALLLCGGLALQRPSGVHLAVCLLFAAYAGRLLVDSAPLDPAAPVYGAGVLLCSELAAWSAQLRTPAHNDPALLADRLLRILAVALAGMLAGALALVAATLNLARSLPLTATGAAAAAAAIWLIAILTARAETGPEWNAHRL